MIGTSSFHRLFLPCFLLCAAVLSQTNPTPSASEDKVHVMSDTCDLGAWDVFLASGRDGQPTNDELLQTYSIGCRLALKRLTQGYFGPASHFSRFTVGCKGICQQWDALQSQGRGNSRCTCEDLDTCDQTTNFWMCKTLYECRTADDHRNDFCNGCGTGQRDEFDFYDELDCGSATSRRITAWQMWMFFPTMATGIIMYLL